MFFRNGHVWNSAKNAWKIMLQNYCFLVVFGPKSNKQRVWKRVVFQDRFFNAFGSLLPPFWEGFGRGLGSPWRLLGSSLASFFRVCIHNALQKGSWELLGSIWDRFWRVWEGSGEGFGGHTASYNRPDVLKNAMNKNIEAITTFSQTWLASVSTSHVFVQC